MSASLPTISMSDKEDAQIREHEVTLVKVKRTKEERQRQWEEEAQWAEEAKRAWREAEAEKAQRDVEAKEAQKMAEVEEAQKKAEDAWRASEAGGEGSRSAILGYGKGKALEKWCA